MPASGGTYALGSTINANYTCTDDQFGTGVATCVGTVPNGAPINTSSLGTKTFTVTMHRQRRQRSGVHVRAVHVVDLPGLTVRSAWGSEGGNAGFVVGITRRPTTNVTVAYGTAAGSATAGTDYTHDVRAR